MNLFRVSHLGGRHPIHLSHHSCPRGSVLAGNVLATQSQELKSATLLWEVDLGPGICNCRMNMISSILNRFPVSPSHGPLLLMEFCSVHERVGTDSDCIPIENISNFNSVFLRHNSCFLIKYSLLLLTVSTRSSIA